ncbi:hypothetical protein BDN70DRAFT_929669 [Pholiota conissans]|uniref:Uncharacterized protein n=1 Tax=Pholiota conissans TaxID=109636 RepID=A0A9P5Z762_9AGAR|nr:hypothetical protein BDN70DRAFT_929669 [Pholiota conissans]
MPPLTISAEPATTGPGSTSSSAPSHVIGRITLPFTSSGNADFKNLPEYAAAIQAESDYNIPKSGDDERNSPTDTLLKSFTHTSWTSPEDKVNNRLSGSGSDSKVVPLPPSPSELEYFSDSWPIDTVFVVLQEKKTNNAEHINVKSSKATTR